MKAFVRDSNLKDAIDMAHNVRSADCNEIKALRGSNYDMVEVLKDGIEMSDCPKTVEFNKEPIAIFGIVQSQDIDIKLGWVWLLGTNKIKDIKIQFLRESKKHLQEQEQDYDVIANYVDVRNEVHIKWLRWLGFNFIRKIESHGAEQRPFYEFARINQCATL
ncbi:phage protein Gp13 family protein [Acinetobacter sp.]|uniref:phage protein Gp13 family protein n=1 Tax=Acinetobacter sp. TaxID=472 RepID=UPI000C0B3E67|nr:phage protein Gp13 family protein [Acinetobacter sp.]MAK29815.1 hypothetical protein [Acinetobacter sp.]|tara:strand:- start:4268 stop:4753 length:486 start_codon:yes stop_codon:yes gene_type:complete